MSDGPGGGRLSTWLLVEGDRSVVTAAISGGIAVLVYALAVADVIVLGPNSNARRVLAAGMLAGVFTLVTISLSVNQLLLSRVFGPPKQLADRIHGTEEFRKQVENAAGEQFYQNDPKEFLSATMEVLADRAERLDAALPDDAPEEFRAYAADVADYANGVAATIEIETADEDAGTMEVMGVLLGPGYAYGLTRGARLRNDHGAAIPDDARIELESVHELLQAVGIFRQFLKTLAIQQDLAEMARLVAHTGVVALATTIVLALVYQSSSGAAVSAAVLRPVVSAGIGVAVLPLAVFVSYTLRVTTISLYTVSAGSFVPPEETFE